MTTRAPRTGMSGSVGRIDYDRYRADGEPVVASIYVPQPHHIEADFYLCTCAEKGENADHFFGPLEAA